PGTPQYMAPEQARGEAVDHRADLFSLGSVLYALCTGRPPFRAASTLAVLRRVSEDTPRPVREINPHIPTWLVEIMNRLHAKAPAQRFQSAAEVSRLLGRPLALLNRAGQAPPRHPPRPARRRRLAAVAAVLVTLLATLGVTEAAGVTRLAHWAATVL